MSEHLAEYLRDWRMAGCNHALMDGQACSPCLRDRLLAAFHVTPREDR